MFQEMFVLLPQKVQYIILMQLSSIIKERRQMLGISQLDLAEMAGIGIATVKSIETDKANPSIRTIEALAEVLGLELTLKIKTTY